MSKNFSNNIIINIYTITNRLISQYKQKQITKNIVLYLFITMIVLMVLFNLYNYLNIKNPTKYLKEFWNFTIIFVNLFVIAVIILDFFNIIL